MLGPFPFLEQLLREGIAIAIAFGIEARAGIAIPVPGAADIGAGLEHTDAQAELAQPVELVHARQAGANDDGVVVERRIWRRGGHPGVSLIVSQKLAGPPQQDKCRASMAVAVFGLAAKVEEINPGEGAWAKDATG